MTSQNTNAVGSRVLASRERLFARSTASTKTSATEIPNHVRTAAFNGMKAAKNVRNTENPSTVSLPFRQYSWLFIGIHRRLPF